MFRRKPRLCRPRQNGEHAACDGAETCDCTWCTQARELAATARDESELLWPLEPHDKAY